MFLREHKHFFGNMIVLVLGKKHFLSKHKHFFGNMIVLVLGKKHFPSKHKHFIGNMIVLVLGKKHFPGKHNHFLGNMVILSWSTWFISNLERERERERESEFSINTIFCININVPAIVTTNIILEDKNPCYCLVFTPYDPVFGGTSHPMAEDFFGVSGPFC
jgi:hypothetical protein